MESKEQLQNPVPQTGSRLRIGSLWLAPVLAVFFIAALNATLVSKVYHILRDLPEVKTGFVVSIPFTFVAALTLIFSLFTWKRADKALFVPLILLCCAFSYAMYQYGIIFDTDMIGNIFETDTEESAAYMNAALAVWIVLLGIFPAVLLAKTRVIYPTFKKQLLQKGLTIAVCAGVLCTIGSVYYADYASVIRNNSSLRKLVVPIYPVGSTAKYIYRTYFYEKPVYAQIGLDARQQAAADGKKTLVIMIAGETQRAMNYSLNGYGRDTNPYTKKLGVISFKNASSCGTATALSVPCMFSDLTRLGYEADVAQNKDNLLDVMQRAGVNITWLDNNAGCKGVCKNVPTVIMQKAYADDKASCDSDGCHDEVFIPELEKQIAALPQDRDSMIVLHLMGSHGPNYYKRYPAAMKAFTPACERSDIQNCSHDELVNVYDNTILNNDFVMSEIIGLLKERAAQFNTALVFMSDHGESLGESGIYLHGMPYRVAPVEQTHIPFIAWFSDGYAASRNIDAACMNRNADSKTYSHDNLFHTMLGMLRVQTGVYKGAMDVFAPCEGGAKSMALGLPQSGSPHRVQ